MDAKTAAFLRQWLSGSIRRIESQMEPTPVRSQMLRTLNDQLAALPSSNVVHFARRAA